MRRFFTRRPSPAMIVGFIALVAALSGTAVALPGINLIDSGDIINGQVKKKDIGKNAVTGKKVKNGSLTGADVKDGSLTPTDFSGSVQGPKGDKGDPGVNGTNGVNGATNVVVRQGLLISVPAGGVGLATAQCNPGERATGGGNSISGSASTWKVGESFPTPGTAGATPTGWRVDAQNTSGGAQNLVAIVICSSP
jgi:hypothetical protein